MFSVYIIESERNRKYYIGCTNDIGRCILEHNSGKSTYTKRFIPWKLVYKENFDSLAIARTREKEIKSWKKRSRVEKLWKEK